MTDKQESSNEIWNCTVDLKKNLDSGNIVCGKMTTVKEEVSFADNTKSELTENIFDENKCLKLEDNQYCIDIIKHEVDEIIQGETNENVYCKGKEELNELTEMKTIKKELLEKDIKEEIPENIDEEYNYLTLDEINFKADIIDECAVDSVPCSFTSAREETNEQSNVRDESDTRFLSEENNATTPLLVHEFSTTDPTTYVKNVHKGIKYECNHCHRGFYDSSNLKKHIYSVHKRIKYRCNICSKNSSQLDSLRKHINNVHKGIKYECNICSKSYSDTSSLRKHINSVHKEIKYQCNICSKNYSHLASLRQHINSVHKGSKYECNICTKNYSELARLKKHINSMHEGIKYECNNCYRKYSELHNLKKHIYRVHKGICHKPNKCKFSTLGSLTTHGNNLHKGEKYECDTCSKNYSDACTLRRHTISVHKRIKYKCN